MGSGWSPPGGRIPVSTMDAMADGSLSMATEIPRFSVSIGNRTNASLTMSALPGPRSASIDATGGDTLPMISMRDNSTGLNCALSSVSFTEIAHVPPFMRLDNRSDPGPCAWVRSMPPRSLRADGLRHTRPSASESSGAPIICALAAFFLGTVATGASFPPPRFLFGRRSSNESVRCGRFNSQYSSAVIASASWWTVQKTRFPNVSAYGSGASGVDRISRALSSTNGRTDCPTYTACDPPRLITSPATNPIPVTVVFRVSCNAIIGTIKGKLWKEEKRDDNGPAALSFSFFLEMQRANRQTATKKKFSDL